MNKEIKMSRERKVKRKNVYGKEKKEKKKKKKVQRQERYEEGLIKQKINKVQGRMSRCCRETKLPFFFEPCAILQRGRHRCLVVLFSFALGHVHHSISSYP
jgi:hypothetical protein